MVHLQGKGQIKCYESGLILNEFIGKCPLFHLTELQRGLGVQYSYYQKDNQAIETLEDNSIPKSILININKEILPEYSPFINSHEKVFLNIILFVEVEFFNDFVSTKELKSISVKDFTAVLKDPKFLEKLREVTTNLIQNIEVSLFSTPLSTYFFETWIYKYLYEVSNVAIDTNKSRSEFFFKQDDIEKIQNLESIIKNARFNNIPAITEMAESVGMSPTKFKKIFKEVFGKSTRQYILDIKVKQAQSLIQSSGYSISQVAQKLGFNNTSELTRLLKNKKNAIMKFGCSSLWKRFIKNKRLFM